MTNQEPATIKTAAERIKNANTIAIVLPAVAELDVFGSAHALVAGLKSIGKGVSLFAPPTRALTTDTLWSTAAPDDEPLREFIISFDLTRSPIKELRYEKAENRLNIILSPTSSRLRREDMEFRYGPLRYDLVITLAVRSPEDAASGAVPLPELLEEKPILNIDANPANTRYGELDLVPARASKTTTTTPTLIYQLLEELAALPNDAALATALFTAIASATKNFHPRSTGAAELRIGASLLDGGADPKVAARMLEREARSTPRNPQLLGRALARSRLDERTEILWLTLTQDDFIKTHARGSDAVAVLEEAASLFPSTERLVVLWQEPNTFVVHARVQLSNALDVASLGAHAEVRRENANVFGIDARSTFPEAEARITELLRHPNAVE